ncbi:MAG: nucleotidyl transferase AbiEii/AbiGii toxin family protein [Betaproteobacteria bacterium]
MPKEQRALWPSLAPAKDLGYTLYGGTAVALRLGHRASADFDFFTERSLDKRALHEAMPVLRAAEILQESADTLVLSVTAPGTKAPIKVSFFAGIGFGRFGEPQLTRDGVLRVASLDDLLGTKLKTILDRVELKDYLDIAAMAAAGADVARGLAVARGLFKLNPETSLKAMVYHEDLPGLPAKARKLLIRAASSVTELPKVERLSASLG